LSNKKSLIFPQRWLHASGTAPACCMWITFISTQQSYISVVTDVIVVVKINSIVWNWPWSDNVQCFFPWLVCYSMQGIWKLKEVTHYFIRNISGHYYSLLRCNHC